MKKLISSLMIGLIASTSAMTTMAASHEHQKKQPVPQQINKKPLPHKHVTPQNLKPAHHSNYANKGHHKNNQHNSSNQHFAYQTKPIPPKHNHYR